ncbi:MAG: cofactor-independent phosphoglycerate mutase [Phycisphaerales bacterium]
MKYAIIIPDGAADFPLDALDGKTPFEAARKPNTDALAVAGRIGTVATTPPGYQAGSDVCSMSLLGFDPAKYHPGRAPLEAAAMGIVTGPNDWIFRCNLITVIDGIMSDHSAGHIPSAESKQLLTDFATHIAAHDIAHGLTFYPGVSYRNIMVDASGRDYADLNTVPPHDVPGEPMKKHLPKGGKNAKLLQTLIAESEKLFADHEINKTRVELGESPASHVWLWGPGKRPNIPTFQQLYGLRGAMITAVDLLAGISALIGWDRLDVPGVTGYHDTDYAAKGRYACSALDVYDIVCVHVEAPDEASHQADAATKLASIEAIDRHIVGPVAEKLKTFPEWRLLYLPDHYTRVDNRKHDAAPPPFMMSGSKVAKLRDQPLTEANANASGIHIAVGHELMEYFLRSGL